MSFNLKKQLSLKFQVTSFMEVYFHTSSNIILRNELTEASNELQFPRNLMVILMPYSNTTLCACVGLYVCWNTPVDTGRKLNQGCNILDWTYIRRSVYVLCIRGHDMSTRHWRSLLILNIFHRIINTDKIQIF